MKLATFPYFVVFLHTPLSIFNANVIECHIEERVYKDQTDNIPKVFLQIALPISFYKTS